MNVGVLSTVALAVVLNAFVQTMAIGAYAARYAGVRSGRVATSISHFNLFGTASRLASLFLVPALGAIADRAARTALDAHVILVAPDVITRVTWQYRAIVFGGTVGTAIGTILLPTFVYLFVRGIGSFERSGSVIRAALRVLDPKVMVGVFRSARMPTLADFRGITFVNVPRKLLIANVLVSSVYSVGVAAAYLASDLNLDARTTSTGLSGLINGFATIAFTLIVDPTSAFITDQAVKGDRPFADVRNLVIGLALTAILGSLLSQILLSPAAAVIAFAAHYFAGVHR
jgi:hypothetical protein